MSFNELEPIRIVYPDGSMEKSIEELFAQAGYVFSYPARVAVGTANTPLISRVQKMRPAEIGPFLQAGEADLAFLGGDWYEEKRVRAHCLAELAMARASRQPTRIVLAVPEDSPIRTVEDLRAGDVVYTEYVLLTRRYLKEKGIRGVSVRLSLGKTEAKPYTHGATAIVEVVESGDSLTANRLRIVEVLLTSATLMIANTKSMKDPGKRATIEFMVRKISGVITAREYCSIMANVPLDKLEEAKRVLSGMAFPNVTPSDESDWFDVMACVPIDRADETYYNLGELGAKGICISNGFSVVTP